MDSNELTEREIMLIEKMGTLKAILEIHDYIFMAMVVRLGGNINMDHAELEFARKTYVLMREISTEDYTKNVRMKVRMK